MFTPSSTSETNSPLSNAVANSSFFSYTTKNFLTQNEDGYTLPERIKAKTKTAQKNKDGRERILAVFNRAHPMFFHPGLYGLTECPYRQMLKQKYEDLPRKTNSQRNRHGNGHEHLTGSLALYLPQIKKT